MDVLFAIFEMFTIFGSASDLGPNTGAGPVLTGAGPVLTGAGPVL
jgi:hypothetical protein